MDEYIKEISEKIEDKKEYYAEISDKQHVIKGGVAIGVLKEPVHFYQMGTTDKIHIRIFHHHQNFVA